MILTHHHDVLDLPCIKVEPGEAKKVKGLLKKRIGEKVNTRKVIIPTSMVVFVIKCECLFCLKFLDTLNGNQGCGKNTVVV